MMRMSEMDEMDSFEWDTFNNFDQMGLLKFAGQNYCIPTIEV